MDINDLISGVLGSPTPTGPGLLSGLPSQGTDLGLSLLANSGPTRLPTTFGQALGQSAIQAQDMASQNIQRRAQLAQSMLALQMQKDRMAAFQNAFAPQGAQPQPQGAPPAATVPGQSAGPSGAIPQASQPTPQVQASNQNSPLAKWLAVPDQSQIFTGSVNPAALPALGGLAPDMLKGLQAAHAQQLQLAQQRYAPQIAKLMSVVQSDNPTRDVNADPVLRALWQQYAQGRGLDPSLTGKDFTAANLRQTFGLAANQYRAALSEATVAPPVQKQTTTLPDGRVVQTDPVTGTQTIQAPSPLEKVVDASGNPVLVPTGKAAGMRPYNQFSAATDSDLEATAKAIADYQMAPPTGSRLTSGNWPAIMRMVRQFNPNYDATQYTAKNKARMAFATGKQGDIVRSLSVATDHLDQLGAAAQAMQNGNIQLANKIANEWGVQTGNPSVTNFNSMREIVGDEVVKAVVGSSGAQADRDAIKANFSSKSSPAQIAGAISKYKALMGGQLNGLRRQYQHSTGLNDFDQMVSPTAQNELSQANSASRGGSSKAMPTGARLQAYAAAHFGGDTTKASAFLKSQGYQ